MYTLRKISCRLAIAAMLVMIYLFPHKQVYASEKQNPNLKLSFVAPDGKPLSEVKFSIIKVADGKWNDSSKYGYSYITLPASDSMLIDDSILKVDGSSAKTIENTFYGKSFQGEASAKTASDGTITFKMNTPGLYVLWQSGSSNYKTIEPMLIPIPLYRINLGKWNYDVSANLIAQPVLASGDGTVQTGTSGTAAQTSNINDEDVSDESAKFTPSNKVNEILNEAKSLPEKDDALPIILAIIVGVAGVGCVFLLVEKTKDREEIKKNREKLDPRVLGKMPEGKNVKVFRASSGNRMDDE